LLKKGFFIQLNQLKTNSSMRKLVSLFILLVFCFVQTWAQDRTITGKVTDENGAPISGASVLVKGSKTGTTTKGDGTFSLNVPASAKQLVISGIGFGSATINLGASNTVTASLKSTAGDLSDVVITGYSRVKKSGD
jgi:hypothetical protein